MIEFNVKINVDTTELDSAIAKAYELRESLNPVDCSHEYEGNYCVSMQSFGEDAKE